MIEEVRRITGRQARDVRRMSGALWAAELDGVGPVVVKRGPVAAEAAGLRWLAEPAAVRIPRVHGNDSEWLVLDRVGEGRPSEQAAEELGRGLAELHASGAPKFGAAPPGGPAEAWIGLAPMANVPGDDWPSWYAEHRVLPYLREARQAGTLSPDEAAVIERACDRLPRTDEPPARLHGDLWNGNVLWGAEGAWLIDPAAHGGHRETDLAMLHLFGCPHLERIVAAYNEVQPLADGWRERIGIHQLFPLLVHTVLFGRSYAAQAVAAAKDS